MTVKSCADCPSFLTSDQAEQRFGRSVGAPMCGRFGYVLNAPRQNEAAAADALIDQAEKCPTYGEPLPGTAVSINTRVVDPSADVLAAGPTNQQVLNCHGCVNAVKVNEVMARWGFAVPVCKAKGSLILNPIEMAKGCQWASPGTPSSQTYDLELRTNLRDDFIFGAPEVGATSLVANGNLHDDPTAYESDAPVEPEDLAEGIRAWRKLTCPYGTGNEIYLPIFDSSPTGIFSETERTQIPQAGDDHHPELYVDYAHLVWRFAVEEWQLGQTLLLQSFPGLGKTEFAYHLGWLMQIPVTRLYFTRSIEWDDIFGKAGFSPEKGTYWVDGRFTAAYRRPGIELVDEPNMAKPEIVATLRTTTEHSSSIFLDAGYGESEAERAKLEIKGHKYNFRIWAANPAWDPRNIGTQELAAADISRLSPYFVGYPPEQVERAIIQNTVLEVDDWHVPEKLLDDLLKVSTDIRAAVESGDYPGTWGIRENIKVARKLRWYPFIEAFRMAALNYFEPETAAFVIDNSIKTINAADIRRR